MVNRNQNVDEVIYQVRQDNMAAENNLTAMVERIMVRNSVNIGLCRPNYTSHLSEYILQTEFPKGWKVPNFTKSLVTPANQLSNIWPGTLSRLRI